MWNNLGQRGTTGLWEDDSGHDATGRWLATRCGLPGQFARQVGHLLVGLREEGHLRLDEVAHVLQLVVLKRRKSWGRPRKGGFLGARATYVRRLDALEQQLRDLHLLVELRLRHSQVRFRLNHADSRRKWANAGERRRKTKA